MKVKNLHDTESYRACQKLVAEGKFDNSILIPMKWEMEIRCGNRHSAEILLRDLTAVFGEPAKISSWTSNYDAPWFFSAYSPNPHNPSSEWSINVNLTTDEQLTYMRLLYAELDWA